MPTVNIGANTGDSGDVDDARMRSANPDVAYGGTTYTEFSNSTGYSLDAWSLFRFDFTPIPSPVTVSSVTLYLYLEGAGSGGGDHAVDMHVLLRDWEELQATWNSYTTGNAWTTPGALGNGTDRETAAFLAGQTFSVTTGEYKTFQGAGLVQQVQDWINGAEANNGFGIYDISGSGWRTFTAKEGTDSQRPYMSITYEEAGQAGLGFSEKGHFGSVGFGGFLR